MISPLQVLHLALLLFPSQANKMNSQNLPVAHPKKRKNLILDSSDITDSKPDILYPPTMSTPPPMPTNRIQSSPTGTTSVPWDKHAEEKITISTVTTMMNMTILMFLTMIMIMLIKGKVLQ